MQIIERLFGIKCAECRQKITGEKFRDLGPGWLCQSCHDKLKEELKRKEEESKRMEQERKRIEQEQQLFEAVKIGDLGRAKALLNNGANVNVRNSDGNTPLHVAAAEGRAAVASLLIERGASVNVKQCQQWSEKTPLDLSLANAPDNNGCAEVCILLLQEGAEVSEHLGLTEINTLLKLCPEKAVGSLAKHVGSKDSSIDQRQAVYTLEKILQVSVSEVSAGDLHSIIALQGGYYVTLFPGRHGSLGGSTKSWVNCEPLKNMAKEELARREQKEQTVNSQEAVSEAEMATVQVEEVPIKIPYRETIKARIEVRGQHITQTGGRSQFGNCKCIFEPLPRGRGFEFIDNISDDAIPVQWRSAVEKGIRDSAERGALAGYPVVDFKVELIDGSYHSVDSDDFSFALAGRKAFETAMESAHPVLLEPIMSVEVVAPQEFSGDIMGEINSRRGRIQSMDSKGTNQIVKAIVPMAEMLTFPQSLSSITSARGSYSMEISHYDEVPAHLAQKIVQHAVAEGWVNKEEEPTPTQVLDGEIVSKQKEGDPTVDQVLNGKVLLRFGAFWVAVPEGSPTCILCSLLVHLEEKGEGQIIMPEDERNNSSLMNKACKALLVTAAAKCHKCSSIFCWNCVITIGTGSCPNCSSRIEAFPGIENLASDALDTRQKDDIARAVLNVRNSGEKGPRVGEKARQELIASEWDDVDSYLGQLCAESINSRINKGDLSEDDLRSHLSLDGTQSDAVTVQVEVIPKNYLADEELRELANNLVNWGKSYDIKFSPEIARWVSPLLFGSRPVQPVRFNAKFDRTTAIKLLRESLSPRVISDILIDGKSWNS